MKGIRVSSWRNSVRKSRIDRVDRIIGISLSVYERLSKEDHPAAARIREAVVELKALKRELEAA